MTNSAPNPPESQGSSLPKRLRILHLSDLHFDPQTNWKSFLLSIQNDLKQRLDAQQLDYLVVSGDFADKFVPIGYSYATELLSEIMRCFNIQQDRCLLVPGNHDVDLSLGYIKGRDPDGKEQRIKHDTAYRNRFGEFAKFHNSLCNTEAYSLEFEEQGVCRSFWDHNIQFLLFNSSWQIEMDHQFRAHVHPRAISNAIIKANEEAKNQVDAGRILDVSKILRIAVFHHPVRGYGDISDRLIKNGYQLMEQLHDARVRLCLHGDIHRLNRDFITLWNPESIPIYVWGSGTVGAKSDNNSHHPQRMYSLIEVFLNGQPTRIHARFQAEDGGSFLGLEQANNLGGETESKSYCVLKEIRHEI